MLIKKILCASLLSSFALSTVAEIISDPVNIISGATTVSNSARQMEVWFTLSEPRSDCYANVYDANWPGTHLYHTEIANIDDAVVYSAKATIPQHGWDKEKVFVITCGGEDYQHKVPRPPQVRLAARVDVDDAGVEVITADAYIDNQEAMGKCWSSHNLAEFDLLGLNGEDAIYFRADYFIDVRQLADGQSLPLAFHVFCQNSGGLTRATQRWDVQGDGSWQLVEYVFDYQ